MAEIQYLIGDVTQPKGADVLIVQCVNNLGLYGAGVSGAIARRWPVVEQAYRKWFADADQLTFDGTLPLGRVQFVRCEQSLAPWRNIVVANIVGQDGVVGPGNPRPIRYLALRRGLQRVRRYALEHHYKVHMPRIGAGLAGGRWERVASIINAELINHDVAVVVYDLEVASGG